MGARNQTQVSGRTGSALNYWANPTPEADLCAGFLQGSLFILPHIDTHFPQLHLWERLLFLRRVFLAPLLKIRWLPWLWFITGSSILSHWSVGLFLCQYYTGFVTMTVWQSFKSGCWYRQCCFVCSGLLWLSWVLCVSIWILSCCFFLLFCFFIFPWSKALAFWWRFHWSSRFALSKMAVFIIWRMPSSSGKCVM